MTTNDGPGIAGTEPTMPLTEPVAPMRPGDGDRTNGADQRSDTRQRAEQAAGTAQDEAKNVAGTARDEARKVVGDAKSQARGLVDDAMGQLEEQTSQQKGRLAATLGTVGDDLEQMSDQSQGTAANLVGEAAGRVRALATRLDQRQPQELLEDVRRFARQRPGTFLLGALVAGVAAGRVLRGAREDDPRPTSPSRRGPSEASGTSRPPAPATTRATTRTGEPLRPPGPAYDPVQRPGGVQP